MKLKELLNNETFLSEYGDYETVGNSYTALRENDKLRLVFDIQKPKPNTVWDLEKGDKYFVVCYNESTYKCDMRTWGNGDYEKAGRETGILFLTKEEAIKDIERRKVETLLLKHGGRRCFKCDIANWAIRYNHIRSSFEYGYANVTQHQSCIYFDTKEQAVKAVTEIGEERLKRALFEVR